jgi:hypothetical protein
MSGIHTKAAFWYQTVAGLAGNGHLLAAAEDREGTRWR